MLVTVIASPSRSADGVAMPRAVLWDMDGTLVDTEPFWMDSEFELVREYGGTWTHEDALGLVGNGLEPSARILQAHGVDLSVPEIVTTLVDRVIARLTDGIPWRPGSRELLQEVVEAGIPCALVTMSTAPLAHVIAANAGFDAFATVVTGDEVSAPKPHPEAYLEALRRLRVDADGCVAIEDSEPGVAAAVAAGLATVAIPFHVPLPPSPNYVLWDGGLAGRSLSDLATVAAAGPGLPRHAVTSIEETE